MTATVMTGVRALALTLLLATPAAAQMPHINMMPDLKSKSPEEREREEKAENKIVYEHFPFFGNCESRTIKSSSISGTSKFV